MKKNEIMTLNTEEDIQLVFQNICCTISKEQYRDIKAKYVKRFGHRNSVDAATNEMIFSVVNGGSGELFNKLQKLLIQEYNKTV